MAKVKERRPAGWKRQMVKHPKGETGKCGVCNEESGHMMRWNDQNIEFCCLRGTCPIFAEFSINQAIYHRWYMPYVGAWVRLGRNTVMKVQRVFFFWNYTEGIVMNEETGLYQPVIETDPLLTKFAQIDRIFSQVHRIKELEEWLKAEQGG